jgi:inosine triphosphate pyrophosphatase
VLTDSRKWFLDKLGHEGLNNLLMAYEDKSAQAVCTFGYSAGPGEEPILFQGITDVSCSVLAGVDRSHVSADNKTPSQGKIVSARGPPNFGWDPIFEYEGKTYAS